jgi:hypothetical protein
MATITIWRAALDTNNFHFDATGLSDADALKALREGLEAHARQYRLAADWWRAFHEQISLEMFDVGTAYRDGEPLP